MGEVVRLYLGFNAGAALIYPPPLIFLLLKRAVRLFYILITDTAPNNKGLG